MGYYSGTIQKGSQGDDVKKWQEFLNTQGYTLGLDGDFGDKTYAATTDWQSKNGLTVDGVVGEKTWGKAGFKNMNTPTQAPAITNAPTAPTFDAAPTAPTLTYTPWLDTEQGQSANKDRQDAETALNSHGDFNYLNQDWMNQVLSDIKNRKEFSYNLDEDALYQQYKDKYIKQGKMAMEDTIGQASAMTGGYGNSYAQSVGNQAYNAQLENLNDIVPELYQMAYDRYNNETQDLYNQYGLLLEDYAREYGEHSDEYNKLLTALNRADSEFYNGANLHQTEQSNANTVAQNNFKNEFDIWDANNTIKQNNWQNEFNLWDANNQNAWKQAEWDESLRQLALSNSASYSSSGSAGSGSSGGSGSGGGSGYTGGNGGTDTTGIPQSVKDKFAKLESNNEITEYALQLIGAGYDESEIDKLVAQYSDSNEKYVKKDDGSSSISYSSMVGSTKGWSVVSKGGTNLTGIDSNAKVKAPNGETFTLKQLKNKLISEGMKSGDASKKIKALQQNLGISSNWMFGW